MNIVLNYLKANEIMNSFNTFCFVAIPESPLSVAPKKTLVAKPFVPKAKDLEKAKKTDKPENKN